MYDVRLTVPPERVGYFNIGVATATRVDGLGCPERAGGSIRHCGRHRRQAGAILSTLRVVRGTIVEVNDTHRANFTISVNGGNLATCGDLWWLPSTKLFFVPMNTCKLRHTALRLHCLS